MADYSYGEIMRMQNDAMRRVEEMQRKARKTAGLDEAPKSTATVADIVTDAAQHRVPMPKDYLEDLKKYAANSSYTTSGTPPVRTQKPAVESGGIGDRLKSMLGGINFDGDTALVLSLIMLLSEENADETLILALLYLLT